MRKIVSDTTPILSLLKIDKLFLLQKIYSRIIIPEAVLQEIEQGKNKYYYRDLTKLDWIEVQNIESRDFMINIHGLDDGEAEVIILAKEIGADLILMDEIAGRGYAKKFDMVVTGTIGILIKSKENGLVESVGPLLNELIAKGTWLNQKLISKALKMANETDL